MAKKTKRTCSERRRARIEELVGRDELSAKELKEFVYLVCDEVRFKSHDGEIWLPSIKEHSLLIWSMEGSIQITLLDGFSKRSGEVICLMSSSWHIGTFSLSYYSKFLGRKVRLGYDEEYLPIRSKTPLSEKEHGKVANLIWAAYLRGVILRLLEEHA